MSIIELSLRFPSQNQVIVKFENEESETLAFESPVTKKDLEDLRWYIEVYAAQYTGEPDDEQAKRIEAKLITLGENLFNAVFIEKSAKDFFNRFQQQYTDRLLTIKSDVPKILALPWELLREPQNTFLFQQQPRISIRRYCLKIQKSTFTVKAKSKLRLLFVVSRPKGDKNENISFLDPRLDAKAVMSALAENDISQIEVEFLRPATLKKLTERLENKNLPPIDIIHFDGHGKYNEEEQLGYLLFETSPAADSLIIDDPKVSKKHEVSAALLSKKISPHHIALVVLSACESAKIGNEALGSVAAGLTDKGVPTVLAMVYSVLVQTTRQLFTSFYQQIAIGEGIGAALDSARQQMAIQNQRGIKRRGEFEFELTLQDWFVPALYSTGQNDVLLQNNAPKTEKAALYHNLPALQAVGFFGRSGDLWQIERWFVQGVERITITGFGGQGKTYLAIEAAHWLLQTDLFDVVCFVDFLNCQGRNTLILRHALNTNGVTANDEQDPISYVLDALGTLLNTTLLDKNDVLPLLQTRRLLWVWDNLESLTTEALEKVLMVAVQWSSAQCHFLFTTRQHRFTQAYYTESNVKHKYLDLQGLEEKYALDYFNQLWQTSWLPEQPYPAHDELIDLFTKVSFHPLAIYLLAQQLRIHPIEELELCFQELLLYAPEYDINQSLTFLLLLLPEKERELVKRLGVFQGGAFEDKILEITEIDEMVWAGLRSNLENAGLIQSCTLVRINDYRNKPATYIKVHPILSLILWVQLTANEKSDLFPRYCYSYYELSNFLSSAYDNNAKIILPMLEYELPNMKYALKFLSKMENMASMGGEYVAKFATNINKFLSDFGSLKEKTKLFQIIQPITTQKGSHPWYLTLFNQSQYLMDQRQYYQAAEILQEILDNLDKELKYEYCITLSTLGRCFAEEGKTQQAINYYQQSLNFIQQLKDLPEAKREQGAIHNALAAALSMNNIYSEAKEHYTQALNIAEEVRDLNSLAITERELGTLELNQGNTEEALAFYKNASEKFKQLQNYRMMARTLHQEGLVYKKKQLWIDAEDKYRKAAEISHSNGYLFDAVESWLELASLAQVLGNLELAEGWYHKAIEVQKQSNPIELARSLNNLAYLLQTQSSRLSEAKKLAEQTLDIKKNISGSVIEIWNTYFILAEIADKENNKMKSREYRQLSRDSYLNFEGMSEQMKQYDWLIKNVLITLNYPECRQDLEVQLEQLTEDWQNLVKPIQYILNGEHNESVLLEPLNYEEAAIIHTILQGIENPESLETLFNS